MQLCGLPYARRLGGAQETDLSCSLLSAKLLEHQAVSSVHSAVSLLLRCGLLQVVEAERAKATSVKLKVTDRQTDRQRQMDR